MGRGSYGSEVLAHSRNMCADKVEKVELVLGGCVEDARIVGDAGRDVSEAGA